MSKVRVETIIYYNKLTSEEKQKERHVHMIEIECMSEYTIDIMIYRVYYNKG